MSWPAPTIGPTPVGMTVERDPGWRTRRVVRYEHRIRNAEDGAFRAGGLVGPSARPGGTRRALRHAPARPADRAGRGPPGEGSQEGVRSNSRAPSPAVAVQATRLV